ncbi:MAG TPA: universal stress protein [Gaiellaceae bacterium]|jgi:nucleotide-binding universal stress UspA family protein|nr:universal stress protein [Gaiellaceae bacterium]
MSVETPAALEVFDRIVCGIDGTPEALEAARQAECLRSPEGRLRLAAVTEVGTAVHAGWAMSHVLVELDAAAHAGLERAAAEVHPSSARMLAGDPIPCLLDEIAQTKATLVAVGPRGHGRAAGILLGGVAATLLHEAPCSVLLARQPQFGEFPSSIVVGVDGSPQSLAAAAVAHMLAERFGSEYLIVAAMGGNRIDVAPIQTLSPYFVTDPGRPAEVLTDLSKEADLLVVGSRGLHGLRALGSVSERVGQRASSSVLVVRDP